MAPNVDSESDAAARALLQNLGKIRKTKSSGLEDDHEPENNGIVELQHQIQSHSENPQPFKRRIVWKMFIKISLGHVLAAWALYPLCFEITWSHAIYVIVLSLLVNAIGAVMAAHRYYSHRTFKANVPLRIFMIIFQTMCTQGSAWYWARNHRQHHKHSDTDADPHNAGRGFFFSHIGWAVTSKHPLVVEKAKEVNTADLDADAIINFQRRHYYSMLLFFGFLLPMLPPVYIFGDTWWNAFLVSVWLRMALVNHATFCINSWAHHFGTKPYDKSIRPVETMFVSIVTSGDGWHNFHHTFPQDYRASEYGAPFNFAATLIDMFAYIGWATDLKAVTPKMIAARSARTGDGTELRNHPESEE